MHAIGTCWRIYPFRSHAFERTHAILAHVSLTARALVALTARGAAARGESGTYFRTLLAGVWSPVTGDFENPLEALYTRNGYVVRAEELAIVWDPELKAIAQEYESDPEVFKRELVAAWVSLMNADRFDGPSGSVCS